MAYNLNTIEDCLEFAFGLKSNSPIEIESVDHSIMHSIARQVYKGTALTDRQFDLMKVKLRKYRESFLDFSDNDFETVINNLRIPLRQIDRTKEIILVDSLPSSISTFGKQHVPKYGYIKLKFPFSKKDIAIIDKINKNIPNTEYYHKRGSHEHFYKFTGKNSYHVVEYFKNRNFQIDEKIVNAAEETRQILENKKHYSIHISDKNFKNFNSKLSQEVTNDIGNIDNATDMILIDRRHRYSYDIEFSTDTDSLVEHIAKRENPTICIDPENFDLSQVVQSLDDLDRFPIIVTLDDKDSYEQLVEIHSAFQNIVSNEQQSVLFRVSSDDKKNSEVNQYIKDKKLNNWVDSNTKIVYINKSKLPKVLIKSSFVPKTAMAKTSYRSNTNVSVYVKFNCDLIINHDKSPSLFNSYSF